jgi:prevent-host-death family protein
MMATNFSSREFSRNISRAKREADVGPVILTVRGKPTYVLLRYDAYRRLTQTGPSILDLLNQPEGADIEFDPPRLGGGIFCSLFAP